MGLRRLRDERFRDGIRDTVEAANGGQDMEMCWENLFGEKLVRAVRDGLVSERRIDEALARCPDDFSL
jgi:beta-glucosidase